MTSGVTSARGLRAGGDVAQHGTETSGGGTARLHRGAGTGARWLMPTERRTAMTTAIAEPSARRKFWGWGLEGEGLSRSELEELGTTFAERFGLDGVRTREPPRGGEVARAAPRLAPAGG